MRKLHQIGLLIAFTCLATGVASAQSFRVQCPNSTITHPAALNDVEPAYTGPTTLSAPSASTFQAPTANVNGAIKCQQISGGDGYATMGDGTQTYLFSFGPLSGLADIASGHSGSLPPSQFNIPNNPTANLLQPGDPATTVAPVPGQFVPQLTSGQMSQLAGFYNGAVGLDYDVANTVSIYEISEAGNTVTVVTNSPLDLNLQVGATVLIAGGTDLPAGYKGNATVTAVNVPNAFFPPSFAFRYTAGTSALAEVTESPTAAASFPRAIDGHVDPRQIMDEI